ncbi:MAG: hypothetical protein JSV56_11330 [Methanomassiliicoccales archaeon]|nr:MAG: hypothetical protein JSV56_11330 [Methanomassiliicoccales archaeon]
MMARLEGVEFLSLDKTEDQLVLVVFACLIISFFFGLQPGGLYAILWAATGLAALICIYFAFPHMWQSGLLLYASYGISAFGVIFIVFWYDLVMLFGISIPLLIGFFFIASAFYIAFHIIQNIKKVRDASVKKDGYPTLGFWSIGVFSFVIFSILSILGWALWADSGGGGIRFYQIFEPVIAFLLVYTLWLPDRNIDWSGEKLPESTAAKFITDKSKAIRKKVVMTKKICPECGSKLRIEKKICPSCNNTQKFGWCVTSEAYVLPCTKCGSMSLYGKEKCSQCQNQLFDKVVCSACQKAFPIKEWIVET